MKAARHVRGYAHDASKNIKAIYAAGPLPEDPALIKDLEDLADLYRSLELTLSEAKSKTFKVAERYLAANKDRIKKDYELANGSPSIRLRLKSRKDGR
jgi:hypothetical protein